MQLFKRKNKTKTAITTPKISIDRNNLIEINGHSCIISDVKRLEYRKFYDSTWEITFSELSSNFSLPIKIVRYDGQTKDSLINTLNNIHSFKDIMLLDERGKIYYD